MLSYVGGTVSFKLNGNTKIFRFATLLRTSLYTYIIYITFFIRTIHSGGYFK